VEWNQRAVYQLENYLSFFSSMTSMPFFAETGEYEWNMGHGAVGQQFHHGAGFAACPKCQTVEEVLFPKRVASREHIRQ
jgi:hypothetical protein